MKNGFTKSRITDHRKMVVFFSSFFRREQFSHFHDGRKEVADENGPIDLHTPEQTSCSQGKRPIVAVNGSARNASYSSPFSAPVQLRLRSSFVTISTFSKLSPTRPQWPCLNQITLPSAKSSSRQPRCGSRNGPLEWHRPRRHSCFRTRDDQ